MDVATALRTLGLEGNPAWKEIRGAHRDAIVRTHPDRGGDASAAAAVNQAYDLLRVATADGAKPLTAPPPPPTPVESDRRPAHVVSHEDPTEVLMQMAEAAHEIGEVVFVDPIDGLLEVVVGEPPGVGQLTASVSEGRADGVPVSFTLEPLGVAAAPPIHEVVDELMTEVRRRARSARRRTP